MRNDQHIIPRNTRARFLLLAEGQIGDLVLLTPALRGLRASYPEAEIDVITVERRSESPDLISIPRASVLSANRNITNTYSINRRLLRSLRGLRRLRAEWSLVRFVRQKRYDVVISTFAEDRFALWAYMSGARLRIGERNQPLGRMYNRRPDIQKATEGVLRYYCHLAKAAGAAIHSETTELPLPESSLLWGRETIEKLGILSDLPLIVLHPGASGDYKIWPPEEWARLIERIDDEALGTILLCGSSFDKPVLDSIAVHVKNTVPLIKTDDIGKLAGVLRRAALCVSNDSGPRHVAVAVGTPSLALFRLYQDKEWGIYEETLSLRTVKSPKRCPYCPDRECRDVCPPDQRFGSFCMRLIESEEVVQNIRSMLRPAKPAGS